MTKPTFQERAERVKASTALSELIGKSVKLRHVGSGFQGLCPFHHEKTASFSVNDQLGRFKCFGCGASGDAIDWIVQREGANAVRALEILESGAGLSTTAPVVDDAAAGAWRAERDHEMAEDRARKIDWARRLWTECRPLPGTPAELYLRARSITIPAGPALAFHTALKHPDTGRTYPGMVAAVTDAAGQIFGIHRTFLAANGKSKADVSPAKMMAGVCLGKCVRFGRPGEASGHVLAIGEGIESCLSVRQATGLPVWAALSLANMGAVPVPDDGSVSEVVILADADEADRQAADAIRERAADAYTAKGFTVRIACPPEGTDFNDVLRKDPAPQPD